MRIERPAIGFWGFALATASLFLCTSAPAQNVTVAGSTGADGSYATLGAAFTAINANTNQTGNTIAVSVVGDTNEAAATATLNQPAGGSWTSLTITPSGVRTITGATTAGSPMIDLNGADNVTIDGLNTGGNSLTIANTTVSATSGTSTIRFIGGATNNTITNANIQGSVSSSVATNGAVIFFSTDGVTANGNDNNTISNNNIGPAGANLPTKAILGNGSTTTTAIGNSGIVINNNNIFDFFGAAVTSAGIATNGGCNTWTITNNRFYQTAPRTWTTGALHSPINIGNTTATSGAQGFTITGNIVGYSSNTQTGTYALTGSTGTFRGIVFNGITGGAATNINGNTVASVSVTGVTSSGTSSSAPFMGIYVTNGVAITNGNTIGSQAATGSLTYSTTSASAADAMAMFNFSLDAWTANSNTIGGITASNLGAGAANVYGLRLNTSSTVTTTLSSNTIGGTVADSLQSTSTATGAQVAGIFVSTSIATVSGNTIRNLTAAGGTGTTTAASVVGIDFISATPVNTASQNTIFNLRNSNATAASVVTGIQFTGATGNVVERNLIYGLSSATNSAAAEINGIRVAGGTTVYRNNMLAIGAGVANAIGAAASNAGTTGINGINEALGTDSFFHNSVYIGGSPTAGVGASYAFNGTQTVNTRSFRDNIFFNGRSNGGATGKHYAVKINGTAPNPTGLTINNNVYLANGTGAVFGFFNSLDVASLVAWKAAVGQDAGSFESNPQYLDPTNAIPDLHIHPTNPTVIEGNGADVGVTNDFDGQTRASFTPVDIGADAGNFNGVDLAAPGIGYTPLTNTSLTTNRVQSVTITDVTGVATGGLAPRVYFNKNAGAYSSTTCSLSSGTTQNGVWACTIDNSLVGGVVTTDVIRYFVVAQDVLGNLTANPNGGFTGTDVNTVTTPPTTPNQYTIVVAFSGFYDVGTGQTYTSLTNAGGIFEAINAGALTGNVTLNIVSDLPGELGTNALNQWSEDGAGGYTLLIKPSGAPRAITGSNAGALIRLNGADRVTIDGSTTGATASGAVGGDALIRELTIQNTNVGTSAVVISVGSGANGAQNDTIRNVNVLGQDPLTTLLGISLGGTTPGTVGTDNDNNRIENCSVQRAIFGIYSAGASAANPNIGTVITMNQTSGVTADRIRRVGIVVFNENGVQITLNSVNGVSTNESADGIGIGVGTQGIDATNTTAGGVTNALVTRNKIDGVASLSATGFSAAGIAVAGSPGGANTVVNNMISGVTAPSTSPDIVAGVYVVGAAGSATRLYHNSVALTGDRGVVATQMPSFGVAITGADPTVELKNNVFYTTQIASGGGVNAKNYAIGMVTTTFANLNADFNDFFTGGALPGFFRSGSLSGGAGTDYATLALWQAAVADDASSRSDDPSLVNPASDLHLQSTSTMLAQGTPVAGVTVDFDGQTRSATNPDIGADETIADLSIADADSPDPVDAGTDLTYTITASNAGPGGAQGASWSDTLPAGTTFVSLAQPGGWTCSTPPVGSGGVVSCSVTPFAAGSAPFTLVVHVGCLANGTVLTNTVTVGATTSDPNAGNNSATVTTNVSNILPTPPTAANDGPVCSGGTLNLSTPTIPGATYSWNGPNGFSAASQNPSIVGVTTAASGTYNVTVSLNGCSSSAGATNATVNPTPSTPTATPGGPTTFCQGGSVTLSSSSGSGNQWYIGGVPIGGATGTTYNATATGSYTVVVTSLGCPSAPSAPVSVTATPDSTPPSVTPPANITVNQTVCCGAFGGVLASEPAIVTFLAGATATDTCVATPTQLPPQLLGVDVTPATCFVSGVNTVTFRFQDLVPNTGSATATVTVRMFGDLDLDNAAGASDLIAMRGYLNLSLSPGTPPFNAPLALADLNHDGFVDASDLIMLRSFIDLATTCVAP